MKCPEIRQRLALLSLGDPADRPPTAIQAEIELHLRACPECRRWVEAENQLDAALTGSGTITPPSKFTERTMARIRRNPIQERLVVLERRADRDRRWWLRPAFAGQGVAAAATFLLAVTPLGRVAVGGFGELTAGVTRSVSLVGSVGVPDGAVNLANRSSVGLTDLLAAIFLLSFVVLGFTLIRRIFRRLKPKQGRS